jgi:hypothetical protein
MKYAGVFALARLSATAMRAGKGSPRASSPIQASNRSPRM